MHDVSGVVRLKPRLELWRTLSALPPEVRIRVQMPAAQKVGVAL